MQSHWRRNRVDPASDLDRRRNRVVALADRRVRADPLAPPARALCAPVAADGARAARALALARRPEHDRQLVRRRDVSPGDSRRRRSALHPARAPAVLDRDLTALRPEHDSGPTARAARAATARGAPYGTGTVTGLLTT